MKENILSDLTTLLDTINLSDGSRKQVMLTSESMDVLQKLVRYIRNCSWSDNETVRFVASNFTLSQNDMPLVYARMNNEKDMKADSTFRGTYKRINDYLRNILPTDVVKLIIEGDSATMKSLSNLIDAMYSNDRRAEDILGGMLCNYLSQLEWSGSKRYSISDCDAELKVLKSLSEQVFIENMQGLDTDKLGYIYYVLMRPSVIGGKFNKTRLEVMQYLVDDETQLVISDNVKETLKPTYIATGLLHQLINENMDTLTSNQCITKLELILNNYASSLSESMVNNLRLAKECLANGNTVSSVITMIKSFCMGEWFTDVNTQETYEVEQSVEIVDWRNSIKTSTDVETLLEEIKTYCIDNGIEYTKAPIMTTGALNTIREYIGDVKPTPDTYLNSDVVNFIHLHCTKSGIMHGLKQFSAEDVAYVMQELDNKDKDMQSLVTSGVNIDGINKIGNTEMCSEAKKYIESIILDTVPSEYLTTDASTIFSDYSIDGMKQRVSSVNRSELAKAYDNLVSEYTE